jgi:hypothetical protein
MRSKHLGKLLGAFMAAALVVGIVAPLAQATTPNPGYTQFAGCPNPKTEANGKGVEICVYSVVKKGSSVKLGNKTVPIENPITLSGGTNVEFENFVYNSKGGLSVVKQKVPGGVIGLTGLTWLLEFLGSEALTLYAATELAGTPVFHGAQEITLPIKVHLINGTLGNNCYVGSSSNPITLHLTTGTSGKLTGKEPELEFDEKTENVKLPNGKYVDGVFSAPGASGCVLTLFGFIPISINGLVNSQSGLPAPSGTNETTQFIDTELSEPRLVYP